jgi:hypothetical protein
LLGELSHFAGLFFFLLWGLSTSKVAPIRFARGP